MSSLYELARRLNELEGQRLELEKRLRAVDGATSSYAIAVTKRELARVRGQIDRLERRLTNEGPSSRKGT